MRRACLRFLLVVGALAITGCQDAPTLPEEPNGNARLNTVGAPDDATQTPACCDPIIVVVPGPEQCDPYLQLDFSCDDGGGSDPCMSATGAGENDRQSLSGCYDGGGLGPGPGGGGGFPAPPGEEDASCNPLLHPDCEKPLTPEDLATVNLALETMLRPADQFTDPEARQQCAAMVTAFRSALAQGAVYRGAFDSDRSNDPGGGHYGYTADGGTIHFDPKVLDPANAGDEGSIRQIAITALHEVGHRAGFQHFAVTWDNQARDYYSERPFSHLNPGDNSCVPR